MLNKEEGEAAAHDWLNSDHLPPQRVQPAFAGCTFSNSALRPRWSLSVMGGGGGGAADAWTLRRQLTSALNTEATLPGRIIPG